MMNDLKPCPFCGAPGLLLASSDHSTAWQGGCSDESCSAFECIWKITEAEAIDLNAAILGRIDRLMDAKAGTPEGEDLLALTEACERIERFLVPMKETEG